MRDPAGHGQIDQLGLDLGLGRPRRLGHVREGAGGRDRRRTVSPLDLHGLPAAAGVVTAHGGPAAVVARSMGKPAVVGPRGRRSMSVGAVCVSVDVRWRRSRGTTARPRTRRVASRPGTTG
ncbi:hypothetical protein FH608_013635 [Nonomuraea phyllanthi]|uniref:PEP-utilising enzyme mobile domain-containing protein n=1 Tax=Nonomuraea phyllanthi TaxID=2219224 RepID=A0A5C4WNZ8_9ACTN|nr:hypothetical protein FH608_013635 [Nonomuraea phyllanthi]